MLAPIINDNQYICPNCRELYYLIGDTDVQGKMTDCDYCKTTITFDGDIKITGVCAPWLGVCIYDEMGGKCRECSKHELDLTSLFEG